MKLDFIKILFTQPDMEDRGCFYTFERIYQIAPRHYVITNCSNGFINLMKRSSIPCELLDYKNTIKVNGKLSKEIYLDYGSENFTKELLRLKNGE